MPPCTGVTKAGWPCRGGAERGFDTCPAHRVQLHDEQQQLDFGTTGSLSTALPRTYTYDELMAELKANIQQHRKTR